VAAGSVLAVYAIVARAALGSLLYGRIAVPTVAPFGPFVNKNHFAGYVEMAAVLAIGLGRGLSRQAAGAREGSSSWASSLSLAAFAAAAGMGMAVLLSLSRGGVLGLVSGLAVFAILDLATSRRPHPIGRVLVPVGMAALLVALAVALPGEVHDRLLGTRRDDRSAVFRMDTWREAFRAWTASPIAGQGMGAFADTLPRYKTTAGAFRVEHPENEPLEMAVEGGLIGLGAVAFALSAALVRATSGIRGDRDRVLRGVVAGGIAGACGLLVHGLVDFNLRIPSNAALFLVLVALAMAPLGSVVQVGAHRRWFLAALAACAVAAWWRPAPSSSLLEQAKALAAKAAAPHEGTGLRLSQADRAAREYVARRPADPEGWLLAAWTADRAGRREEASALARHAITLDPERPGLRDAVRSLNAH
jgi:O-antigen ligase